MPNQDYMDCTPNMLPWQDASFPLVRPPVALLGLGVRLPLVPPLAWPASLFRDVAVVEGRDGPRQ